MCKRQSPTLPAAVFQTLTLVSSQLWQVGRHRGRSSEHDLHQLTRLVNSHPSISNHICAEGNTKPKFYCQHFELSSLATSSENANRSVCVALTFPLQCLPSRHTSLPDVAVSTWRSRPSRSVTARLFPGGDVIIMACGEPAFGLRPRLLP
ncbi:uncharacterized protein B0H64DRAFT_74559 [Chaetomium fimeti]|uniref:Uncharacterized protein n=1 Tax=Chaetomium fimeti TaxID=1854472 RepID=A0AAE0HKX5_9PEZI|nr:hypothetical protein B0H64DRAFT_74559 [Chaetomium fimeti]